MAKPRPGYVFPLDARVLAEGWCIQREGSPNFYGLQVANRLGIPKIHVYRALRRLTELGLVERRWEDQDLATAEGRPRRRLYVLTQHGIDARRYALQGARVFGRMRPRDSNSSWRHPRMRR